MVNVLTRHFPRLGIKLERFFTNCAVRLRRHVAVLDFDDRHRLDCGFRSRRMVQSSDAVFQLGQLVEQSVETRAHQEIGHAGRQRAKTQPCSVVVVQLERSRVGFGSRGSGIGRPTEDNYRVERGSIAAASLTPTQPGAGTLGYRRVVEEHRGGRKWMVERRSGRGLDLLDESGTAIGAKDRILGPDPDPNQAAARVAPVGGAHGSHGSY